MDNQNNPPYINGAQLLLEEVEAQLKNKRISQKDKLQFKVLKYHLESLIILRSEVHILKKHDWVGWMAENPKFAILILFLTMTINNMINWKEAWKPVIQALISLSGVHLPLN